MIICSPSLRVQMTTGNTPPVMSYFIIERLLHNKPRLRRGRRGLSLRPFYQRPGRAVKGRGARPRRSGKFHRFFTGGTWFRHHWRGGSAILKIHQPEDRRRGLQEFRGRIPSACRGEPMPGQSPRMSRRLPGFRLCDIRKNRPPARVFPGRGGGRFRALWRMARRALISGREL